MKRNLKTYIAQRIRSLRLAQKMSQEDLSERANLGIKYIHNIENQKFNFKIETLEAVIEALGLSPEEFFDFTVEDQPCPEFAKLQLRLGAFEEPKRKEILKSINRLLDSLQ